MARASFPEVVGVSRGAVAHCCDESPSKKVTGVARWRGKQQPVAPQATVSFMNAAIPTRTMTVRYTVGDKRRPM